MPFSPGFTSDDKVMQEDLFIENFNGKDITITEKMDGECTSLYNNHYHARSIDSGSHPSRNWVKRYHAEIKHAIPPLWRICGENLFARHSISYDNLDSYFYGFSIWDENNVCLSYEDTKSWFELLGIYHVPVVGMGRLENPSWPKRINNLATSCVSDGKEGIVMRINDAFKYEDFSKSVVKYVRKNHVTTNSHWMHEQIVSNRLR